MDPLGDLLDPLLAEPFVNRRVIVILGDEVNPRLAVGPAGVEFLRDTFHPVLVAAAVSDQHDVGESVVRRLAQMSVNEPP